MKYISLSAIVLATALTAAAQTTTRQRLRTAQPAAASATLTAVDTIARPEPHIVDVNGYDKPGDLVRFIGNIFSLFENIAGGKDIETGFRSNTESFYTLFDYDVMEKIVTNLVSNAFKYTPRGCFVGIEVVLHPGDEPAGKTDGKIRWISLIVTNTGTDIPEDRREHIFDAFSKIPSAGNTMESSTGLGLAIVRELVSELGGRIVLKSENSTVSFEVLLPFVPEGERRDDTDGRYEYAVSEADNLMSEASFVESEGCPYS